MADVAAMLHARPRDVADRGVGAVAGVFQGRGQGGDVEDAPTRRDEPAVTEGGAGVDDVDALVMRKLFGAGKPKQLQGRSVASSVPSGGILPALQSL